MTDLEKHPSFNPDVKISGIDEDKAPTATTNAIHSGQKEASVETTSGAAGGSDCDLTGFAMFEEQATAEKPKSWCRMFNFVSLCAKFRY